MKILLAIKKYFPILYIVFLIFFIFYVKNVLNSDDINVSKYEEEETVKEADIKPVDVKFEIYLPNGLGKYEKRLTNISTFDDLILKIRKEEGLTYEKIGYTYGYEYDFVNGDKTPDGYQWHIYENDDDVTHLLEDRKLVDGYTYTMRLEKR